MKIALICNEYPPHPHGGIGTFVQEFARALDAAGHEVFVFGQRDRVEDYRDGRIVVRTIGGRRIPGLSWLMRRLPFWRFVREQVKQHSIDIVETTDFLGLLPYGVGCPVVVRLHQTATALAKFKGQKRRLSNVWFEGQQLRSHGGWIGMSQYALDLTCELFPSAKPKRFAIIHPPIDLPAPAPTVEGASDNFVLFTGFVEASKGALALARAARHFLPKDPTLQLVYAGAVLAENGRPVDELVREIVGPELAARIVFMGWIARPVVLALMSRARFFILPSRLESFGLVVAEAMLQGCPVIASNRGPFPEFVRNGETGLLIDPEDTDAIAEAAIRLLKDRAFAEAMGKRGQAYISASFSREKHLDETLAFYERELDAWKAQHRA